MLVNFFRLDGDPTTLDALGLSGHLAISRDLRSALYEPDDWLSLPKRYNGCSFTNVSLSKTRFSRVTFTDCKFEDCLFIGSTFVDVEFHRCRFINCNFYKVTFDRCYIDPSSILLNRRYRKTHANIGVHLYQQIYEDASKSRQADFAMKADIEFRKWKRWQLKYDQRLGKISRLDRGIQSAISLAYEWLMGFGYKPLRFILATLALFLVVSALNMCLLPGALKIDGEVRQQLDIVDAVFYTFSMMTVLGFSFIVPQTSFAKLLTVSQALAGIGWLGIFTSLLVKRFTR